MAEARRLGPAEITLIVIDVVLIGVLIFLLATAPDGPDEGASDEPTTTQPAEPATDETTSSTSTQAVTAPEGALEVAEFQSPSGNIWCTISDTAALCQIADIDYQPPQIEGCADNELAGRVVQVSVEGAEYPCPTGNIPGADAADRPVLEYDPEQTTAVGDFMCTSKSSGVTCTNLSTGSTFTITRNGPSLG